MYPVVRVVLRGFVKLELYEIPIHAATEKEHHELLINRYKSMFFIHSYQRNKALTLIQSTVTYILSM